MGQDKGTKLRAGRALSTCRGEERDLSISKREAKAIFD